MFFIGAMRSYTIAIVFKNCYKTGQYVNNEAIGEDVAMFGGIIKREREEVAQEERRESAFKLRKRRLEKKWGEKF